MRSSLRWLVVAVLVIAAGAFAWSRRGTTPAPVAPAGSPGVAPDELRGNPSPPPTPARPIPPVRTGEAEQLVPRPPGEWQGMPIDLSIHPYCEKSEQCGMARACRNNTCIHCVADGDCAGGEVCVLDQCVTRELARCRRAADCGTGELCVLSPYSADPRGNTGMRAFCMSGRGEQPSAAPQLTPGEYQAPAVRVDELTEQLHRDASP